MYKSILVISVLTHDTEEGTLKINLPFRTYAQNIVCEGKDITYRLNDLKNDKKECLAKVDYMAKDYNAVLKSQTKEAEAFVGNMGNEWENIKKDARYSKHYNVTKKDALATYTDLGEKIPYDGADKDEVVKFCQWEESLEKFTLNTTDICIGGMADASGYAGSGTPSNAFDDSTLNGWRKAFSRGDWISYTLASEQIAYRYRFYYTFDSKSPKIWTFEGYDGTDWVELDSRNVEQSSGGKWTDWYTFSNNNAYIAYRMVITEIKRGSEIEMREIEINGKELVQVSALDTAINK